MEVLFFFFFLLKLDGASIAFVRAHIRSDATSGKNPEELDPVA